MRISDWSSDVCSSDLVAKRGGRILREVELSTGVDEDLGIRLLRLGSAKDIARCLLARVARQRHQRGGNAESAVALLRNLIGRALDRAGVAEFGDLVECLTTLTRFTGAKLLQSGNLARTHSLDSRAPLAPRRVRRDRPPAP